MIRLIVCDLDGTLCNDTHRAHLASAGDWDGYHGALILDKVHEDVRMLLDVALVPCILLTGRPEEYRIDTVDWLERNGISQGFDYRHLVMRDKGQTGSDTVIKPQNLAGYIDGWLENIDDDEQHQPPAGPKEILILDDRDKVVEEWRNLGYNCWQTRMGSF